MIDDATTNRNPGFTPTSHIALPMSATAIQRMKFEDFGSMSPRSVQLFHEVARAVTTFNAMD